MDFQLSDEERAIQELARRLSDGEWEDLAREWDVSGEFDRRPIMTKLREAGLAGMTIPQEYGGAGASYLSFILALEQIVRTGYPAAFLFTMTCSGPIDYILKLGSEELRKKYLPALASGEWLGAIGITEPDAGSDIGAIRTRARIEGEQVRINGAKLFVGGGGECEVYIVFVRMSDEPGVKGIGCVAIDRDAPGLKFGPKFRMMGSRPVPRSELIFEDCIIPADNVLARPGEFGKMMEIFNIERMHNACFGLGMALGAYEHALDYARQRVQFGRPLIANQGIQWKLAEMQTVLEAARGLIYKAAVAKDQGEERLGVLTSQAKLFAAKNCPWVVDQALQIEGAYGYSEGSRVERMYRDIRLVPIAAGTVEMMLNYLGRQLAH